VDNVAYSNTNWTDIEPHTTYSSSCDLVAIPDVEFERRLMSTGIDTTGLLDGYILRTDAEAVTGTFNTSEEVNEGMTDYTGIEAFINITGFIHENFNNDQITVLDLSNNLLLETIELDFTMAISDYDFTSNINVKELAILDNIASIASLNLDGLINLEKLELVKASFNAIDVSTNINLKRFEIEIANNLLALNLDNNTGLERINITNCDGLDTIDLHNNVALINIRIHGSDNLTSIRLDNGTNISVNNFDARFNPSLICVQVDNVAYSNTNWTDIEPHTAYNELSCNSLNISPKVFLQGASLNPNLGEEMLMRDDLRSNNLIPLTSPYNDNVTTINTLFDTTGNDAIVDWIWVELRDAFDNSVMIEGTSALLQRDGDVVDYKDGISPLAFSQLPTGNYYIAIKHRNHLGIITAATVSLSSFLTIVNFTDSNNQIAFGSNAQTVFGMPPNTLGMWTGNANTDTVIQYSGITPDTPTILSKVLNDAGNFLNFPTYTITGYNTEDINMDGNIQYTGTTPDTPFILQNILAHPDNFLNFSTYQIQEQLPEN
jgi:hypothetical protein